MSGPGTVDDSLYEGIEIDRFLLVGAGVGLLGWLVTQYLAGNPGLALETVGIDGTKTLVGAWAVVTFGLVVLGVTLGARSVRYSPPLWVWGLLITGAFVSNAIIVGTSLVSQSVAQYALFHPWLLVYSLGFLGTAVVAGDRVRSAYLLGSVGAVVLLLAVILFPQATAGWIFAVTGVVHAGPLVVDVVVSETTPVDGPDGAVQGEPTEVQQNP